MLAAWNMLVCLVVSIVCWSFLLGSGQPGGRHHIVLNAGLLLLAVGMFTSAFAPVMRDHDLGWWTVLARTGAAVVAAVLYEGRFGVRAQLRALLVHWRDGFARVGALLVRLQGVRGQGARR